LPKYLELSVSVFSVPSVLKSERRNTECAEGHREAQRRRARVRMRNLFVLEIEERFLSPKAGSE
jgi:hypothetical protein